MLFALLVIAYCGLSSTSAYTLNAQQRNMPSDERLKELGEELKSSFEELERIKAKNGGGARNFYADMMQGEEDGGELVGDDKKEVEEISERISSILEELKQIEDGGTNSAIQGHSPF